MELRAHTSNPESTRELGAALAAIAVDGDLIVLSGQMGVGKTCFTQGVARGLGIGGRVNSPTFTLANSYEGRLVLNHLDAYRLDDPSETLDLDLPELLEIGITVIEWGERINSVLPKDRLEIVIRWGNDAEENERTLTMIPSGPRWVGRTAQLENVVNAWTEPC